MRRGDEEYEAALSAMEQILLGWVARPFRPLYYSHLSELLAGQGHNVPAHDGPMPYLLEDCTRLHSDGAKPMLSAVVVLKGRDRPSNGFFTLARQQPFLREGDDEKLWIAELEHLEREYVRR